MHEAATQNVERLCSVYDLTLNLASLRFACRILVEGHSTRMLPQNLVKLRGWVFLSKMEENEVALSLQQGLWLKPEGGSASPSARTTTKPTISIAGKTA